MGEDEIEYRYKRVWDCAFAASMVAGCSGTNAQGEADRVAAAWRTESVCAAHRGIRAVPVSTTPTPADGGE